MIDRQILLCSDLRRISIRATIETVNKLRNGLTTEKEALSILTKSLREYGITNYWYPAGEVSGSSQFGCIVVFDTKHAKKRTAFSNARTLTVSERVQWEGIGYFYMSPQLLTPQGEIIWGDFASSIYTGRSPSVRSFFRKSWHLSESLLDLLSKLKNITTNRLFKEYKEAGRNLGIKNIALSKTGPKIGAGTFNIGHSFPWFSNIEASDITPEFMNSLLKKRIFIDDSSDKSLEGAIWSLESRDHALGYSYGAISFHRLFAIKDNSFVKLPDHDELFEAIGMDWIWGED